VSEELQVAVVETPSVVAVPQPSIEVLVEERAVPIVLESPDIDVVTLGEDVNVVDTVREISIVTVGEVGPPGPAGAGGAGTALTKTAGTALSGHRAVVLDVSGEAIYADNTVLAHRDKVLGLTSGAASAGADVTIVSYGEITEPSWTWTLDEPVFLGANGLLTQTAPALIAGAVFLQRIGFPNGGPMTLFVDIDTAITL